MKIYNLLWILVGGASLITGCGGSSSSDDTIASSSSVVSSVSSAASESSSSSSSVSSSESTLTGVFLDSPVANIGYQTDTLDGTTNDDGEFQYIEGETITFYIGDLEFPGVTASSTITPLDLAGTTDSSSPAVVNIIRLLQSLDKDGNPDNGIEIDDAANTVSVPVDFSVPVNEFAANSAVVNLVANSGSIRTTLVSQSVAISHFEQTLVSEGVNFTHNSSVVGVWRNTQTDNDLLAFVFFADGTYAHVEIDEQAPFEFTDEDSGMEWGTYALNTETGLVDVSQVFDNNGDSGLTSFSGGDKDLFIHVSGDVLTLDYDENGNGSIGVGETLLFSRQQPEGLVGPWVNTTSKDDFLAFIFFDDDTYVHLEVDEVAPFDVEGEVSGMEWGSYSLNSDTGALTIDIINNFNDDTGLSDQDYDEVDHYVSINGDVLELHADYNKNGIIDEDEDIYFQRP
ncbi:hypothetical protein [Gilvimarinus sp. 1_MG-2023]|uniref:hypothetical protein n=1 Tax=Gilvimarinus sp. 1_MG-2023 TaxID=3062638 RepID=UPI0026E33375|nr:hypothetical protein [Gilvimarinus sp. 1_MG-2023]MDO6748245.1 hypothetical protein [Gilvimarinus sp. 1_MG-2023]